MNYGEDVIVKKEKGERKKTQQKSTTQVGISQIPREKLMNEPPHFAYDHDSKTLAWTQL